MKKVIITIITLLISCLLIAQGPQTPITVSTGPNPWNTQQSLLYLPDNYNTTSTKYPIIIFLHGAGEAGSNLSQIYNSSGAGGPAYLIAHNQWPSSFTNPADGQQYKFIVVSPQASSWSTSGFGLDYIVQDLVTRYRIDTNRIYLTGLSAGGQGIFEYTVSSGTTPRYKPAAMVIMSGTIAADQTMINTTITDGVHVWGFGSSSDLWGIRTRLYVNGYTGGDNCPGSIPFCAGLGIFGRYTEYSGGHCCWMTFYPTTYHELINGVSMNIYEWMLQYKRFNIPLPISLVSFTYEYPYLIWSTITEIENDHFEIEESNDGMNWNKIASIPSKAINGNSNNRLDYNFNIFQ